jgi:hypothetical protein
MNDDSPSWKCSLAKSHVKKSMKLSGVVQIPQVQLSVGTTAEAQPLTKTKVSATKTLLPLSFRHPTLSSTMAKIASPLLQCR